MDPEQRIPSPPIFCPPQHLEKRRKWKLYPLQPVISTSLDRFPLPRIRSYRTSLVPRTWTARGYSMWRRLAAVADEEGFFDEQSADGGGGV